MVDPLNHENAMRILISEILDISNMATEFLNGFIGAVARIHGAYFPPLEEIELADPPKLESIALPYFVDR
jgi:hypothetical protein